MHFYKTEKLEMNFLLKIYFKENYFFDLLQDYS